MASCMSLKAWDFEIKVCGTPLLLLSNAALLNVLCSSFINCPKQVVIKIITAEGVQVSVLTENVEAEKMLLKSFSNGTMLNNLKMMNGVIADIEIVELNLLRIGFVLDSCDIDFETIKAEVQSRLVNTEISLTIPEIILSTSPIVTDTDRIISETLNEASVDDLINNTLDNTVGEVASSSSIFESVMEEVPHSSNFLPRFSCGEVDEVFHQTNRLKPSHANSPSKVENYDRLFSDNSSMSVVEEGGEVEAINLRDYQVELAQPGIEGRNCLILAPTGSGKTIVAAQICKTFIERTVSPRILFLVPRVPLVQQQCKVLKRYLGADSVYQVCGDSTLPVPSSVFIKRHIVSVMTAEILLNLLNDVGDKQISFDDIGLLIFDECHHAMKKHVYNRIMHCYFDILLSRELTKPKLPQIVGLSASPGVGKAKTVEIAAMNIKTLMANLDVVIAPTQAIKHADSLRRFQNPNGDEVQVVDRHTDDAFANNVKKAMRELEKLFSECCELFANCLLEDMRSDCTASQGGQDYEAWCVSLYDRGTKIKDETASRWFMSLASHLREYNTGLVMNDHVRSSDVKEYLEEALLFNSPRNEVTDRLQSIYQRYEPQPTIGTNPLLEKLSSVLVAQYTEKPLSRCIIFTKTRAITKALLNYLSEQEKLTSLNLNPLQMTGAHAKSEKFGMTKAGQSDTLKAFREGQCRVLVSTSVAEEGLDIKECNLIITYNYSTNEVGKVQRKGRGRAEDSRFVILAYRDSGHIERERANDGRVELSQEVLLGIRRTEPDALEREIREIQREAKRTRDLEAFRRSAPSSGMAEWSHYAMLCVGCKQHITSSDCIRHINKQHHVVADPKFRNRVRFISNFPLEVCRDVYETGRILCNSNGCGATLGWCMIHKKIPIYILDIKHVLLEHVDGKRTNSKKWSKVPFSASIEELDPHKYSQVLEEMLPDDSDDEESGFDEAMLDNALRNMNDLS